MVNQTQSSQAPVANGAQSAASQNHWQQMASLSENLDFQSWLELQSGLIDTAFSSLLVIKEDGQFKPVAVWPEANKATERLTDLVEQVIDDGSGMVTELGKADGKAVAKNHLFGVAYPVSIDEQVSGVIAVAVNLSAEAELPLVMNELQWGASWVELSQMRRLYSGRQNDFKRLNTSVDLLAKVLPESGFNGAAMRLITELAINLNCNLVSLGVVEDQRVKLAHLSHSADFGSHMNLVRAIENAMDESVDQREAIMHPVQAAGPKNLVTVAHTALAEMQQSESLLTIPLHVDQQWIGAITLQRDIDQPFTVEDLQYCESVVELAVSALQEKRFNDRPLRRKIRDAGEQQLLRVFGPGYLGRKLILGVTAILVLLAAVVDGEYRLSADASLQTVSQQVISAPFEGYLKYAHVRAGDVVEENDQLLQLDDRDLLLEQLKWRSQQSKLSRQYQEAIAAHDRARITILDAQLGQAKAQLNLVESQLQRASIVAPFAGLVVSGDLSKRLGGSVTQGEVLFEISPVNAYRVDLLVKESRIADLQKGQTGTLYLSALPDMSFEFSVNNISPVTEFKDGATFFVVEAILHASPEHFKDGHDRLRPGMEGIGKVYIDERNLFGIWTRELRDWLRLSLWRWWG